MRALNRYAGWEILAIHALTGVLFALINGVVARALLPEHRGVALGLLPLAAFSWWGWYAEAKYVLRASRDLRRAPRPAGHD